MMKRVQRKGIMTHVMVMAVMCVWVGTIEANTQKFDWDAYLAEAYVVVEGYVVHETEAPTKQFTGYVGEGHLPVVFGIGNSERVSFAVTKIYKGNLEDNNIISITGNTNSFWDSESLKLGKEYVLFLKPDRWGKGYQVLHNGKGQWRIFDCDGVRKIKAWYQDNSLRKADAYANYEELISEIELRVAGDQH